MMQIMIKEKATWKIEATMDYSFKENMGSPELIAMYLIQSLMIMDNIKTPDDLSLMVKFLLWLRYDLLNWWSKQEAELLKFFLATYEIILIKDWKSDIENAKEVKDLF